MNVLGIRRFYIYEHNSTQPMLPMLVDLVKVGAGPLTATGKAPFLHIHPVNRVRVLMRAGRHCGV